MVEGVKIRVIDLVCSSNIKWMDDNKKRARATYLSRACGATSKRKHALLINLQSVEPILPSVDRLDCI